MATKRSAYLLPDADLKAKRLQRLGQLLEEYGADANLIEAVEVFAGGVTFRVSSVLLAQSDVFRGMLTNGLQEAAQRRIELPDMSADCWRALQAYLQQGCVRVDSATAVEVLQAAHMYELAPLADAVAQRIIDACDEGECDNATLLELHGLARQLQCWKLAASAARGLIADFQATEKASAAKAAGPLLGGLRLRREGVLHRG